MPDRPAAAPRQLRGGFLVAFLPLAPLYAIDLAWYACAADEAAVSSPLYAPPPPFAGPLIAAFLLGSPFAAGLWLRGLGAVGAILGMVAAVFAAMAAYDRLLWLVYPPGITPGGAGSPMWVGPSLLILNLVVGIGCGVVGWGAGALTGRVRRLHDRAPSGAG